MLGSAFAAATTCWFGARVRELPFSSFCNRFAGLPAWVVGRGRTTFRYAELAQTEGPVFFINDAVALERLLPTGRPSFFFAHDASMAVWLNEPTLRSLPVLITDQPLTGRGRQKMNGLISGRVDPRLRALARAVFYTKHGSLRPKGLLACPREEIRDAGQLYVAGGSIHPLLHFAWYAGCSSVKLVGCDGLPNVGYAPDLENRSGSREFGALSNRIQADQLLRDLALPAEFLGTPPHRVLMLVEIRTRLEVAAALADWVERLRTSCAMFGGKLQFDPAGVGSNGVLRLEGEWPDVQSCADWAGSSAYTRLVYLELERLIGDVERGLRLAFQAVLD